MNTSHGTRPELSESLVAEMIHDSMLLTTHGGHYEIVGYALLGSFAFNTDTEESDYDLSILIASNYRGGNFTARFGSGEFEGAITPIINTSAISMVERLGLMSGEYTFTDSAWTPYARSLRFNEYEIFDMSMRSLYNIMRLADKSTESSRQFKFLRRTAKELANALHLREFLLNGNMDNYRMALDEERRNALFSDIEHIKELMEHTGYDSARDYMAHRILHEMPYMMRERLLR